jgi:plastocyanin
MVRRLRSADEFLLRASVVLVTAFATLVLLAPSLVVAANRAVTITESGGQYHFSPSALTVKVGDTVTWHNSTDAPHTVTADSGGPMNSTILNQGNSYQATFNAAGTFAYHCEVHAYMHGTIRVEAAASHPTAAPPNGATPLPPTDQAAPPDTSPTMPRRAAVLVLIGVVSFAAALMFGPRLRRSRK